MNVAASAVAPELRTPLRGGFGDRSMLNGRASICIGLYLIAGLGAFIAYSSAAPQLSVTGYLLVSLLPVLAVGIGLFIHRPASVAPWLLLAAGMAAFFFGDLSWVAEPLAGTNSLRSLADAWYLLGYAFLGGGLILFVVRSRSDMRMTPLIDAFAIGMTGALLLWITFIEQFIHDKSLMLGEKLLLLAYPVGDVLLLGFATYLLAGRVGNFANRLLLLAFLALLIGDTVYADVAANPGPMPVDISWLLSYLLIGLVALIPSMRSLGEPLGRPLASDGHVRMAALWLLAVAIPAFAIGSLAVTGHTDPSVVLISEATLALLILLRTREYFQRRSFAENRYSNLLSQVSNALVVIDDRGLVVYASPASNEILGYAPASLVGRSEGEFSSMLHRDDRQTAAERLQRVVSRQSAMESTELRLRHADGTYRWLRLTATDRRDDPSVNGIVYSYEDISASRLAGDRLRFQATILDNIREPVVVTDLAGRVIYWNSGATEVFGFAREDVIGEALDRFLPGLALPDATDHGSTADDDDRIRQWIGRRSSGDEVIVTVRMSVMHDPDGMLAGFVSIARDVTERYRSRAALRRLEMAIQNASEAIIITDPAGTIEFVNPAFERISGYPAVEAIGNNPRLLKSGEQSSAYYSAMWQSLGAGKPWMGDFRNRRKDGSTYHASAVISPIHGEDGGVSGYVGVSRDVSAVRRMEAISVRAVRERALIGDTIRSIDGGSSPENIAQAVCRQIVSLTDVVTSGLHVFELDGRAAPYGFALANGEDGPLRRVPARITAHLREHAEHGPWIEAWKNTANHPYTELFRSLTVNAIAYAPVRDQGELIGLLHISSAAADAEEQLSAALPALVEFADITGTLIGRHVAERTAAHAERRRISAIIEKSAFYPVYQPLVEAESGRIVGYEALTRFEDGARPDLRFVEAAAAGMGTELELACIRIAIDQARDLPPNLWLNINASPAVILDGGRLVDIVRSCPRELVIEVTEHSEVTDYAEFRRAVQRLGPTVRLAVDDAGAGFASLRHILELRPAFVKLDRMIIAGIDVDEARRALATGLVHFASNTGCWLIAEGVETPAELAVLRELGVRYVQGYLLGRPARLSEAALSATVTPLPGMGRRTVV